MNNGIRLLDKLAKWRDYASARVSARNKAAHLLSSGDSRRVLVVCYGNIYRSPFVASRLAVENPNLNLRSAGFHRREGRQVETDFQAIARADYGIDLSGHRSKLLTPDDLAWADLVLIMDGHNYRLMHELFPAALGRTIWLGAVTPATPVIIRDPYGLDTSMQTEIARQLDVACRVLASRLSA